MLKIVTTDLSQKSEKKDWNDYVSNHECGSFSVRAEWGEVIRDVYGHESVRLVAVASVSGLSVIVGVLPLVYMRSRIFGSKLVSMPYFDMGGVLADSDVIEKALIVEALEIARNIGVENVAIRQLKSLAAFEGPKHVGEGNRGIPFHVSREKERMVLALPNSSPVLWASFKSKLRSQIRRAMKAGLTIHIGKEELLDMFYTVFAENMRDLGSPVHAKKLFYEVMNTFGGDTKVLIIKKGAVPVSGAIVSAHGTTLQNPWASSLRRYSYLSPNMLLYWSMLEYACDHGYEWFDFGRSTPGEGTHRFKRQWGAKAHPLHWYQFISDPNTVSQCVGSDKDRFGIAVKYWQKLPIPVATLIGPRVRGQISL